MQISFTSKKRHKPSLHFNVGKGFLISLTLVKSAILGVSVYAGMEIGKHIETPEKMALRGEISYLTHQLNNIRKELSSVESNMEQTVDLIVSEIGQVKGDLIRISAKQDAQGKHHGFDSDEFYDQKNKLSKNLLRFQNSNNLSEYWKKEFDAIKAMTDHLKTRQSIISAKQSENRESESYHFIDRPVNDEGWLSSRYGYRTDPFHGRRAWHDGIDFAGREGSSILAASSGIVTFSGEKYGYGNLVEISHKDGIVTRYGHNKDILVKEGDQVNTGDVIATMGNTGRSTGPHLHFEVIKNSKSKDPLNYLGNPIKKPG